MNKRFATWGMRLVSFGSVVAVAAYAGAQTRPAQQAPNPGAAVAGNPASVATLNDTARITALEHHIKDAEARLTAHNTKIAVLQFKLALLQAQVANLPKPPPPSAPVCTSESVSKGPGGEQSCQPYRCNHATGTCNPQTCATVDDCIPPWVCGVPGGPQAFHCVMP